MFTLRPSSLPSLPPFLSPILPWERDVPGHTPTEVGALLCYPQEPFGHLLDSYGIATAEFRLGHPPECHLEQ